MDKSVYLINCICDSSRERFNRMLKDWVKTIELPSRPDPMMFPFFCLPMSRFIWVWGGNSAFSGIPSKTFDEKCLFVLYSEKRYLEYNGAWIDEIMSGRKWIYVNSETNDGKHELYNAIKRL